MNFPQLSELLRQWPTLPVPETKTVDGPIDRLRSALCLLVRNQGQVGFADLAVLVRHVLRRETTLHSVNQRLQVPVGPPWPNKVQWKAHGCRVIDETREGFFTVEALEWAPSWLSGSPAPFRAAEGEQQRRLLRPVPADPAITDALKIDRFLSAEQADAVRGVVLSPPGSVTIVALPTGAGKSLVGLAAARIGIGVGVSVVVVPTIALAYDQVLQARASMPGEAIDAWKGELKHGERQAIRDRIRNGQQRLIYAAPESVIGALAGVLYEAAQHGLVRAFIADEAHLVGQWGHGFRPDFQAMGGLWRQLRTACPPGKAFRTLLMTATLTEDSDRTLRTFFNTDEGIETLASVYLRPEPDFFIAKCETLHQQQERVIEVLRHGPRPAILYVTKPEEANSWHARLRERGWVRVDCIHGGTDGQCREAGIDRWRRNETDVMVATAAFGLGMDKGDVRLVVHACVPETVDRFYQEVGRGGRDGRASVSMLLWTKKDRNIAAGISSPKIIGEELGAERWKAIRHDSKWDGGVLLADLRAVRPGKTWSESDANMGWNLKTLLLLARTGALDIENRKPPEVPRQENEAEETYAKRLQEAMKEHWSICPVRLHASAELGSPVYWQTVVGASREETLAAARQNWTWMNQVLAGRCDIAPIFRDVYRVSSAGIEVADQSEPYPIVPPRNLAATLAPSLQQATRNASLLVITFEAKRDWQRQMIRVVALLVKLGIRECALPRSFSQVSGFESLHRGASERFVVYRDAEDDEPPSFPSWPLPRLTLCEPGKALPFSLFLLARPLHLILVARGTPDPRHSQRKIGDVSPPTCYRWEALEKLLQL